MTLAEITKEFIQKCGSTRKASRQIARDTLFAAELSNEWLRLWSLGKRQPSLAAVNQIFEKAAEGSPSRMWAEKMLAAMPKPMVEDAPAETN